jgi:hypothetical protein
MVIWWLGNIALAAIVVPVLVLSLKRVLTAASSIPPVVDAIAGVGVAASRDLDAVVLLVTTQSFIQQTIESVADYGGSLDAAVPVYY